MKKILIPILVLVVVLGGWYFYSLSQKPTEVTIVPALYSCSEGKTIAAVFHNSEPKAPVKAGQPPIPTGSVDLKLSDGRQMSLAQTISASGVRYANPDESFVFWSKGNGVMVLEGDEEKSYTGCVVVAEIPAGSNLSHFYSNKSGDFSVLFPDNWTADGLYEYANLGPKEPKIPGVKFTVSDSVTAGTNLSRDTGVSVEQMPNMPACTAYPFLISPASVTEETIDGMTYSVARVTDAAAGNRYEETVYALPGTNPCIAVRYFVHYGAIQNYPAGVVKEFDKAALLKEFDAIRKTLTVNQ